MTSSPSTLVRRSLAGLATLACVVATLTGFAGPASAAGSVNVTFTNTGCNSSTLVRDSGNGLVSYGPVAAGSSRTITTYPTHRWYMLVNTMRVASYTVGTTDATKRFNSYGCVVWTSRLVAAHSGKCLNVPGGSTNFGTRLIQYTCSVAGQTNEKFTAITAPGGYMLQNVNSKLCVSVSGGSTAPEAVVVQSGCSYTRRQILARQPDGSFVFKHSGQCLDVYGGFTGDGTRIQQYPCTGRTNQQWYRG